MKLFLYHQFPGSVLRFGCIVSFRIVRSEKWLV